MKSEMNMRSFICVVVTATLVVLVLAQQYEQASNQPPKQHSQQPKKPAMPPQQATKPEEQATKPTEPAPQPEPKPGDDKKEEHFDMTEVPPVVTHHEIKLDGKSLKYTASAGRLPIKRGDGKIEAEMFFVAYTLDGQEASKRPLTFAFNGGPGSATIWLHMGALGPRRVALLPDGFMPAAPYRIADNYSTALDKTDLVMVDAIGTGFSRAANTELSKKFWGVKGDIEAFGEFIRLYITRYERW